MGASSFGDWFPDEFGNVENEVGALPVGIIRSTDLAHTYAHNVVEPPVSLGVAEM